ncbi:MAG TPA: hypothetical protein PK680_00720 [Novosphingobium sp.]|nr:hypothetical protein [Novosphingobium sp.]HQA16881.1 hypothetical protein [Novosphingobium sp.]
MRRLALALLLLPATPALAQSDPDELDRQVAERLAATKKIYGQPDPRLRCRPTSEGEIVVCVDRGEDQRMGTGEPDRNTLEGRKALNGGVPRAPDLDDLDCRTHPRGTCIQMGWAPPPVYYVDVSKLPEAPEGSDADKIAKGEMAAP